MRLTNTDFKLLLELDKDCRQPLSTLSRNLRISEQLIGYKIKSYMDEGIILSFNAFIDYVTLGYLNFRVYFKINYLSDQKFNTLIKGLYDHPSIIEIIECGGKYDLVAVFATINPSEFNKKLKELIAKNPLQLKNYVILTTVIIHYYGRTYFVQTDRDVIDLFRGPEVIHTVIGGERSFLTVDKKDKAILGYIQPSARISSVFIAKKIKIDPKTIRLRIRSLQEREIIRAFRPIFNVQNLGFFVNKILLKYHNLSLEKEQELLTFCKFNPHVTELIKVFGEWDLELTVETKTREEFHIVYISIREKFEDIIEDFESFPVFKTHQKEFLPNSMFKEE